MAFKIGGEHMNLTQEELAIIIDDLSKEVARYQLEKSALVAKNIILTKQIDELVNKLKDKAEEKEEANESI